MNSSSQSPSFHQSSSFLGTYAFRFFWYVGAVLIVFGLLSMPSSPLIAGMLVPGTIRYLMQSIPAATVTFLTFALLNGHVPKKAFGMEFKWISRIIITIGVLLVAWGFHSAQATWGGIGINVIYWGAELILLPRESQYWEQRRNRQRNLA